MASSHQWKAELYDDKLGYVSQYGRGVVELLQAKPGERILDLGCGTGDLCFEIAQCGAFVIGMDYSEQMLERARSKYPELTFVTGNAENFTVSEPVDAVFSNAALHWVKDAEGAAASVWRALNTGGRFVAEFGGKGNVEGILKAISQVLSEDYGWDAAARHPWYFPSIGEYSSLLEMQGFHVTYAELYERPTPLQGGEEGLMYWLTAFAADAFFPEFDPHERQRIFERVSDAARETLFKDGQWIADYQRIRIIGVK